MISKLLLLCGPFETEFFSFLVRKCKHPRFPFLGAFHVMVHR